MRVIRLSVENGTENYRDERDTSSKVPNQLFSVEHVTAQQSIIPTCLWLCTLQQPPVPRAVLDPGRLYLVAGEEERVLFVTMSQNDLW